MKQVNINGVRLTEKALCELRYLQHGIDQEDDSKYGEPNAGLNNRLEMIDEASRFLIAMEQHEDARKVLGHLRDLMYIRDSFIALGYSNEKE